MPGVAMDRARVPRPPAPKAPSRGRPARSGRTRGSRPDNSRPLSWQPAAARRGGDRTAVRARPGAPLRAASGQSRAQRRRWRPTLRREEHRYASLDLWIYGSIDLEIYRWLIRLAIAAAPNPLSILTTDTPAAQLLSIPRSAASPPKLAP